MKKTVHRLCLIAAFAYSLFAVGCASTNESGQSDLHQNVRNTDLYTLGNEKNMLTPLRPLRSVTQIEREVKRVPGVVQAKVVTFGNTLLVGALVEGQTALRIYQQSSPIDRNRYTRENVISDGYYNAIISTIRPLLTETDYKVIMVTTNPLLYTQIADVSKRQQKGEAVPQSELRKLVNEVGYSTPPFNLVD